MIVFDLQCDHSHRFEGWFGSSSDYEEQQLRGLVTCPECGSGEVSKAVMAPAVGAKGNTKSGTQNAAESAGQIAERPPQDRPQDAGVAAGAQPVSNKPMPAEVKQALKALAKAQEKALKGSTWVGKDFAKASREMHYGERDQSAIHGQASIEEAKALADEGVQVAALPFPIAPPDKLN
jgi:hypothetical protein